jgi:hypothetical protein
VLDLRLYRLTLLPFAVGLVIVAFSLHSGPSPLSGTLPTQGYDATVATQALSSLVAAGGPGSSRDDALAQQLSVAIPPGGFAQTSPFGVHLVSVRAETAVGARTLDVVSATAPGQRPGAIVVLADRANRAATALLIELEESLRDVVPQRSVVLVSTAGGASGMAATVRALPHDVVAAIVIGGVAGASSGSALRVAPWSAKGVAPPALRVTVEAALAAASRRGVGDVSLADQLARLALPLTAGGQGPLGNAGIPAVLAGTGGEVPNGSAGASVADLRVMGGAIAAVVSALDVAGSLPAASWRGLSIGSQLLDGWGVRLLGGLALLSLAGCTLDVLARSRRRRTPVLRSVGWVLSFATPFVLAGLFTVFLGAAGLLRATPATVVTPAELPVGAAGTAVLFSVILLFVLAWGLRAYARRRAGGHESGPPPPIGAVAALLVTTTLVAFLIWLVNPYASLLVVLPAHAWLVALTRDEGCRPAAALAVLALSLAPVAAAIALLCTGLGVSPFGLLWTLVVLVGSSGLSLGTLLLASLAAGCAVAAGTALLAPAPPPPPEMPVTVRGPLTYAGPGSLGGTTSALRR